MLFSAREYPPKGHSGLVCALAGEVKPAQTKPCDGRCEKIDLQTWRDLLFLFRFSQNLLSSDLYWVLRGALLVGGGEGCITSYRYTHARRVERVAVSPLRLPVGSSHWGSALS